MFYTFNFMQVLMARIWYLTAVNRGQGRWRSRRRSAITTAMLTMGQVATVRQPVSVGRQLGRISLHCLSLARVRTILLSQFLRKLNLERYLGGD
jgi:hypothetical protein